MNLKDEFVAGESHSLEFKRVPNEDRGKYLKTVVAVDEAAFATQMNVYCGAVPDCEGNEGSSALLQIVENGSPHNLKSPGRIAI